MEDGSDKTKWSFSCDVDRVVDEFNADHVQRKFVESYTQGHLELSFYQHWARYVPRVYSGLLDVDVASEERKAKRFLFRSLETFICAGDPDIVFQQLKQYDNPPALCGRVFRLGEPTYSCRDCGADPTCVLCVECFQQSIHRNHKYRMSTSGGGGYCDCGDREAWKSGAFCDFHECGLRQQENATQTSALDNLPSDVRQRAAAVFHITVNYAFTMLKWTACENLPADLDSYEAGAAAAAGADSRYVTMLFNDETHTYEQVINTLIKAVGCSHRAAVDFATTVDREGRSVVKDGSKSECEDARKIIEKQTSRGHGSKPLKVLVMNTRVVAHQTFAQRILTWIQEVIGYSDGLRQLFTFQSLQPSSEGSGDNGSGHSLVENVMLSDTLLWKSARVTSHQLFMAGILMDAEYKKTFAILFTKSVWASGNEQDIDVDDNDVYYMD